MNNAHPNSTLTSSTSNQHLRLALQALPYAPNADTSNSKKKAGKKDKDRVQRRRHVEHFVPAIWVPDSKAESCMRCGGVFGWRRRRHHCRLCGNCVCANCSDKVRYFEPLVVEKLAKVCCLDLLYCPQEPNKGTDQASESMQHLLRSSFPRLRFRKS